MVREVSENADVPGQIPGNAETQKTASLLDSMKFGDAESLTPDPGPAPRRERRTFGGNSRANAKGKNESAPAKIPAQKKDEFVQPLTELYTTVGTLVFLADQHVGGTVIEQAPACAQSLNDLAEKNPEVRKVLRQLTTVGAMGAVITAHAPIAMAAFVSVNQRKVAAANQPKETANVRVRPPTNAAGNDAAADESAAYQFPGNPGDNA